MKRASTARKVLCIVLSVVMVMGMTPFAWADGEDAELGATGVELPDDELAYISGDWEYTLTDNVATIVKYNGTAADLVIPGKLDEYRVAAIGDGVFFKNQRLASVTVPATVTSVGANAFTSCFSLESVAFAENSQLVSLGDGAFSACTSLSSVEIPASVCSIGNRAFSQCSALSSVVIPASVVSIGIGAFCECMSLSSIEVEQENSAYRSIDGVLFDVGISSLISYPAGSNRSAYEIPASVISVESLAFDAAALSSVVVPASVSVIGSAAFYGCDSLSSVAFGEGSQLSSIGASAFYRCTSLASIDIPASVASIGQAAFSGCSSLTSVEYYGTLAADGIGGEAFWGLAEGSVITVKDDVLFELISGNADYITVENTTVVKAAAVPLSACTIASIPDQVFTGLAIEPGVTVTCGDATLVQGTDYEVAYSRNIAVGTATATVTGIGGYTGSVERTFNIVAPQGCAALRGDANGNGAVNIVDAQIALDLSNGVYGASYDSFPYPAEWGDTRELWLRIAADANVDGATTALDARAIQVYAHDGAWR